MGLNRFARNLNRVIADVAPIAAVGAQFALPGIGGFLAGRAIQSIGRSAAADNVRATQRNAAIDLRRGCAPQGVVGTPFNSTFQSGTFPSGGALPGRQAAIFVGRDAIGRQVGSAGCPGRTCPCPPRFSGPPPATLVSSQPVQARIAQQAQVVRDLDQPIAGRSTTTEILRQQASQMMGSASMAGRSFRL